MPPKVSTKQASGPTALLSTPQGTDFRKREATPASGAPSRGAPRRSSTRASGGGKQDMAPRSPLKAPGRGLFGLLALSSVAASVVARTAGASPVGANTTDLANLGQASPDSLLSSSIGLEARPDLLKLSTAWPESTASLLAPSPIFHLADPPPAQSDDAPLPLSQPVPRHAPAHHKSDITPAADGRVIMTQVIHPKNQCVPGGGSAGDIAPLAGPARPATSQQRLAKAKRAEHTHVLGKPQSAGAPFPSKPGLEHAFAYACMQHPSAYAFATEMLRRVDTMLVKMVEVGTSPVAKGTGWCYSTPEERYAAIYDAYEPDEIGSSGRNGTRIKEVIEATSPAQNVELREKIALIYEVTEWLPHEIQRQAGIESFDQETKGRQHVVPVDDAQREETLARYIKSLDLDFPISVKHLAEFAWWKMGAPLIHDFYYGELSDTWRKTNTKYFKSRDDLLNSEWVPLNKTLEPRHIEVARHDPAFAAKVANQSLETYDPKYDTIQSALLNGSCFYAVHEDWFDQHGGPENMITMTGPAGSADR
jgi:hypothetical protein